MKHYLGAFAWGVVVLYLCLKPGNQLANPIFFAGADKLAHCVFFFVFTTLLLYGRLKNSKTICFSWFNLIVCVLISLSLAGLTEFLQWKVFTYRQAELWDMASNTIGIGMASFAYMVLSPRKPSPQA
jgi:VanZ family protein